jgi:uncharacterized protein (DUF2236 family)
MASQERGGLSQLLCTRHIDRHMLDLRDVISSQIRQLLGSGENVAAIEAQRTDAGYFGPGSASWKVHGDFTSMMIGGVTALLLQMLHPGALAGVWDHSNFRQDMQGRLKRTARFIAGTTYGSTAEADRLVAHVKHIHDQVSGTLDGAPYSANDADLLTWVHVAEVSSFLAAYLRYRNPTFSPADQDRYYREYALIARKLGAVEVPDSRAAIAAYLRRVRPQLRYDERTREVADALLNQPVKPSAVAVAKLMFEAAEDLLPDWAQQMHGFHVPAVRRPAIRLGVRGLGGVFRWALTNSAEARARRRAAELGAA